MALRHVHGMWLLSLLDVVFGVQIFFAQRGSFVGVRLPSLIWGSQPSLCSGVTGRHQSHPLQDTLQPSLRQIAMHYANAFTLRLADHGRSTLYFLDGEAPSLTCLQRSAFLALKIQNPMLEPRFSRLSNIHESPSLCKIHDRCR